MANVKDDETEIYRVALEKDIKEFGKAVDELVKTFLLYSELDLILMEKLLSAKVNDLGISIVCNDMVSSFYTT